MLADYTPSFGVQSMPAFFPNDPRVAILTSYGYTHLVARWR